VVDNITIDGTEIDLSSGDLTLDVAGDIILDADGGDIRFRDGGTEIGSIVMDDGSSSFILKSTVSNADMKFNGNDGGSGIVALTLDMSDAGKATFNAGATFGNNVGINTTAPAYALDVDSTIHIGNDGGSSFSHSRLIFDAGATSRAAGNFFHNQGDDVEYFAGSPYNKSDSFAICRNATASHADGTSNITNALVVVDSAGNLHVGGSTTPTSSAGNLVLNNGTAPAGSATNGVVLYAEDVSSSSELKVRDEAGNVTTLSPHNFDLIPDGPSEDMAWSYFSERDGKRINVDMLKALRVLERISGEQLIFEN